MTAQEVRAADEVAMEALGGALATRLRAGQLVFFRGELGSGKTTLIRGVLRALGYEAAVKSPTYTLVEPYSLADLTIYHFDLYRLEDPQELEFIGIRDYLDGSGVCLVEWPERAAGTLGIPDLEVMISVENSLRRVRLESHTEAGEHVLAGVK